MIPLRQIAIWANAGLIRGYHIDENGDFVPRPEPPPISQEDQMAIRGQQSSAPTPDVSGECLPVAKG